MSILPPNKIQQTVDTPKNFFIYGQTMHGKSYLAGEFPSPLFLDTDGNAQSNPYPSIQLRNIRGKDGKIVHSVVDQLDRIITDLQATKHTYETIVLDVIDDIVVMIEQFITDSEGVVALADIPYGKGYAAFNNVFQQLIVELKSLPLNIIYISRISTYEEDNITHEKPSLKEKHVNIVNGNCDYLIQAKKVGKNYIRLVKDKRKNYQRDRIDDERILNILDTITGAFEKSRKTNRDVQEKIVQKLEQEEEVKILGSAVEEAPEPTSEPETEPKPAPAPEPTQEEELKEILDVDIELPPIEPEVKTVNGNPVTTRKRPKIK